MRLVIFRHGIAQDRDDPKSPPDPERRLTAEGIQKTRAAARGLRALEAVPDAVLTSPYRRARETADLVVSALRLKVEVQETDALLPDAEPQALLKALAKLKGADTVVVTGHAPHVDDFLARSLGCPGPVTELKKAGAACLEVNPHSARRAKLLWLVEPKVLRALGGAGTSSGSGASRGGSALLSTSGVANSRAKASASQRLSTSRTTRTPKS